MERDGHYFRTGKGNPVQDCVYENRKSNLCVCLHHITLYRCRCRQGLAADPLVHAYFELQAAASGLTQENCMHQPCCSPAAVTPDPGLFLCLFSSSPCLPSRHQLLSMLGTGVDMCHKSAHTATMCPTLVREQRDTVWSTREKSHLPAHTMDVISGPTGHMQ